MSLPDFSYEQPHWSRSQLVAGADEVGRGAFAGPVVAAVVLFPPNIKIEVELNDSKKLSSPKRTLADLWIRQNALGYGVGQGSVAEINRFGIVKATHRAFRRALAGCQQPIDHLLVDAFYLPYTAGLRKGSQTPIPKGDSLSFSIAAASIVAKVHRDALMTNLSTRYQSYLWHQNKGYGTLAHRQAIQKHGVTPHHRLQFVSRASSPSQFGT